MRGPLAGVLGRIAVALAGRAGSRLASGLAVPASRQVTPLPEPGPARQPDPAGKYAERTRRHHGLVHGTHPAGQPFPRGHRL